MNIHAYCFCLQTFSSRELMSKFSEVHKHLLLIFVKPFVVKTQMPVLVDLAILLWSIEEAFSFFLSKKISSLLILNAKY